MLQTVQQPIYAFLSASEERINTNITNLKDSTKKPYKIPIFKLVKKLRMTTNFLLKMDLSRKLIFF